jgi:hypothetical protein
MNLITVMVVGLLLVSPVCQGGKKKTKSKKKKKTYLATGSFCSTNTSCLSQYCGPCPDTKDTGFTGTLSLFRWELV